MKFHDFSIPGIFFYIFQGFPWYFQSVGTLHNERDDVSNHQAHDWLLNHLFRRRSKKTSKVRLTGLWGEFTDDRLIPRTKDQ